MMVVHAGSVSCEKLRGFFLNSYNIIEVENRSIDAKLKVVNGGVFDFEDIIKLREVLEASDISRYSG